MALSDERVDAMRQADNGALNFVTLRQFRAIARAIEAEARRDALEEAAKKCESQWSNAAEKLYGIECAAAIRKLKEDIQEPPRPHAPRQASAHP